MPLCWICLDIVLNNRYTKVSLDASSFRSLVSAHVNIGLRCNILLAYICCMSTLQLYPFAPQLLVAHRFNNAPKITKELARTNSSPKHRSIGG